MPAPPLHSVVDWVRTQRWYAGGRQEPTSADLTEIPVDGRDVHLFLLQLSFAIGDPQLYFVPVARILDRVEPRDAIASTHDTTWVDALAHPATVRQLLDLFTASSEALHGTWLGHTAPKLGDIKVLDLDQSNTSVRFGAHHAKFFRRIFAGQNPELELGLVLGESSQVARLVGGLQATTGQGDFDLAVAHDVVPGRDGFRLAVEDAGLAGRGQVGIAFPGAAYELGIALGDIHNDLAAALPTAIRDAPEISTRLVARLHSLAQVEVLDPFRADAEDIFRAVASGPPVQLQRIHGDLHLGQALYSDAGWKIVDLEGEPRRALTERREPDSALRDIAGVLRSFDYAAGWNGASATGVDWRDRNSDLFLEGYRLQRPDAIDDRLLKAFLLDKALYEVCYETAHRPGRVAIPLSAVAAMCGT